MKAAAGTLIAKAFTRLLRVVNPRIRQAAAQRGGPASPPAVFLTAGGKALRSRGAAGRVCKDVLNRAGLPGLTARKVRPTPDR